MKGVVSFVKCIFIKCSLFHVFIITDGNFFVFIITDVSDKCF